MGEELKKKKGNDHRSTLWCHAIEPLIGEKKNK